MLVERWRRTSLGGARVRLRLTDVGAWAYVSRQPGLQNQCVDAVDGQRAGCPATTVTVIPQTGSTAWTGRAAGAADRAQRLRRTGGPGGA